MICSLSLALFSTLLPQVTTVARAQEAPQRSYFLEVRAGAEYDSVVALDELDLSDEAGDNALLLDLSGGLKQPLGADTKLDLRYRFSVLDYSDFSEVDQNSHILSVDLTHDIGVADIGLSGFYVDSTLGNEDFLQLGRLSPHISGFFRDGWFSRAAYVYSEKSNQVNPGRDARASIAELDVYRFPSGKNWYLNVGYKYRDEDADAARFDYAGHTLKARWVQRMQLRGRDARLELSYRYIDRDYSRVTPSIGAERRDRRHRAQAEFRFKLNPRLGLELLYAYSDYESNLQSVDFEQNLLSISLRYRWES